MMHVTKVSVFAICLALIAPSCTNCGGSSNNESSDAISNNQSPDGEGDDTNAQGGEIDTSDFEGTAVWTVGIRSGIVARELANNEIYLAEHKQGEFEDLPTLPALSKDRSTLVYTRDDSSFIEVIGQVHKRTLGTGEETTIPREIDGSEWERISTTPSTNEDGSLVAYTEYRGKFSEEGALLETTDGEIATWNEAGEMTVLTDTPDVDDYLPKLSDEGSNILFVSERSGEPDFYTMPTDGSSAPALVTYDNYEKELADLGFTADNKWASDDDLSHVVFVARIPVDAVYGAFVLDTQSGEVQRLGESDDANYVDISDDGSTIAVSSTGFDDNNQVVATLELFHVDSPDSPSVIAESVQTAQFRMVELNEDGTTVILAQSGSEEFEGSEHLVLMNADGSNHTLLAKGGGEIGLSTQLFNLEFR